MFKKLLIDILTAKDGESFDSGRVLGLVVVLTFLLFTGIVVFHSYQFDYQSFGIAVGTIFAGIGINLKLKENSEPDGK